MIKEQRTYIGEKSLFNKRCGKTGQIQAKNETRPLSHITHKNQSKID